jgi:RNA polymerase sigma-70 factor (ECF subfamily)
VEKAIYKPSIDHIGIKEIVNRLKPEYKCIIDLMYFAGFSQSEVAKELELPLGTVKTRSRAAIKELRKIVCA